MSRPTKLAVSACALGCLLAGSAFAQQTTTLKNDHFPVDATTAADSQMSVSAGFIVGEIATAVLPVPALYQNKFRVNHIHIMWASTSPGTVPPSPQESVMVYKGSTLQAGAFLVFDSANDAVGGDGLNPQMQDGGLNDFDFTNENIIIEDATTITVGLKFATATNQFSGPSVCSDQPPTGSSATPGRNAIYGTLGGPFLWFDPASLGMHGNFFIRAIIERISTCPADIGVQGGAPGEDGVLDNNDFVIFIAYFFSQNPIADVGRQGGAAGADTLYDNNDFIVYINQFFAGCG